MTKEEMTKKMLKYSDREEKWKKIFFISILFCFIISIIYANTINMSINFIAFAIIFLVISLCNLFYYHFSYEKLIDQLCKINNVDTKIFETNNNKKTYTINYVLEGKYKNRRILGGSTLDIDVELEPLNKRYISSYTVIDETNKDQYSFWKGALGVAVLGGWGAVAGIGGKNKKEYMVAIEWKDGEKSLILIDDEYYKVFVKSMF